MAKRKLSLQQQRRVDRRHRPGDDSISSGDAARGGTVVARYGKQADVLPADDPRPVPRRCHIRANVRDLVAGDRVLWEPAGDGGVISALLPRESLMARPDNSGKLKPLAANVSRIAVVIAPQPPPHQNLIDRYLVAIEHLHIEPLLVINKIDLADVPDPVLRELAVLYRHLGYEVAEVSAKSGRGVDSLLRLLNDETTVFVGQSGVGKSSLINRICPGAGADTGDLSQPDKGRHTTTTARVYPLETGGRLIDSPGIREFGLWHLDGDQVAAGFVEFRPFLGRCKFRNCRHLDEPGCALTAAGDRGDIRPDRLASYRQIVHDFNRA